MFYKLAFQNVKKSLKDYTIYFLTLTFGVCLFYVFNSIDSQTATLNLSKTGYNLINNMMTMIGVISVFISVVLGFLVVYANKFLIKRRKKELGIYMTLGMKKSKISRVLVSETLIIGVISLIVGLIAGVFLSQILSIITAAMFEVEVTEFSFVFSKMSMLKTILYFSIIYVIVIIFNVITISKYKLIDLLTASKKNEKLKVKSLTVSVILFIISVITLVVAYTMFMDGGMMIIETKFFVSIILGCIGTFLFFLSLSGFLLRVIKANKKIYYNKLNMFVLRQVNSKITTTFVSMSIICIMLLITIGILSTGVGISNVFTKNIKSSTPYDLSIYDLALEKVDDDVVSDSETMYNRLKEIDPSFEEYVDEYVSLSAYTFENTNMEELYTYVEPSESLPEMTLDYMKKEKLGLIKLSEYNKIVKSQGIDELSLDDGQIAISYNYNMIDDGIDKFLEEDGKLTINGKEYKCLNKKFVVTYSTTSFVADFGTIIVPDDVVKEANLESTYLNVNFKGDKDERYEYNTKLTDMIMDDHEIESKKKDPVYWMCLTKSLVYDQSKGVSVMATYITIYIGFIFVIAASAILALQQLSDSSDNIERYNLLRKIGVSEKEINKSIFKQVAIAFIMPLSLAIVHSIVGIKVANEVLAYLGYTDVISGIVASATFIIVIYGGYLIATYLGCKMMAKRSV